MTLALLISIAIVLSVLLAGAWAIQRLTGNSGWIDTMWSLSAGIGALIGIYYAAGAQVERQWIAAAIILIWSLRLASHIASRSAGASEDPRYAALMEEWGEKRASRLFWFLQIQAAAAFVLALAPLSAVSINAPFPQGTDWLALAIAVIAIGGETLADRQLTHFRKTNTVKGAVCEIGLWKYSRHPNYFFEWLFWCSWPVLALSGLLQTPFYVLLALGAPAMMYWLLVHVSGIPPLEKHMLNSRGETFKAYQERVNAFFPGPRSTNA
ncbi:DUF1295 domain-containing protein [Rhizobium sp. L1K21]|uniref:DUF1295 domain-containing protein n=1 Tax=Rhizobium sp. L1K21 TaxID=2954933 RepID=UPI0020936256|nr:DUF1295 domain-containing protein [Rhizobium sp. L1K21]MCO6185266.1 DUF1295 domain-containing protein [Rhizobium sp. L1K21]